MNANKPILNLIVMDEHWSQVSPCWEDEISHILQSATLILGKNFSDKEVSVVLSQDHHVQDLNKTFRFKNTPTNVLSFNSEIEGELGDIILAYETVKKEAELENIPFVHHTVHLIIHGFLHLLGYDHMHKEEAKLMEDLEIQILKTLDINNPYEVI